MAEASVERVSLAAGSLFTATLMSLRLTLPMLVWFLLPLHWYPVAVQACVEDVDSTCLEDS